MPLTDIALKAAKPSEKTQRLFDGGGLYLEISPSGGKWWRLKYRFDGKEKRLSLGVYPDVSLRDARARREELRRLLANDIDPGINRKVQKAARVTRSANSFEMVAREWFSKLSPGWVASYSAKVIRMLERDIFPWIGARPVSEVSAPELLAVLRRVEERGAVYTAHRAHQNCSQVFRYAIATGRAERDPSPDLRGAIPAVRGKNFPALTDPAEAAGLLRAIDGFRGTFVVQSALRLAPLLFVRPGELRKAKWDDIDFERAEWRFFVTKTKTEHLVVDAR